MPKEKKPAGMTVRTLMKALGALNPDEIVMLASDEEGNSYHDIGRIEQEWNKERGGVTTIYPEHE